MVQSRNFMSEDHNDMPASIHGAHGVDNNPPLVPLVEATPVLLVDHAIPPNEAYPLLVGASSTPRVSTEPLLPQQHAENPSDGEQNRVSDEKELSEEEKKARDRMMGAGIAAGILSTMFCGPIFGILLGFGTAFATKKEGALGDSARAVGDVALVAQEKAKEIDQKHSVVQRCRVASAQTWEKAKEMDKKHHVLAKTQEFAIFCARSIKEFVQKHKVVERSADAVGQAANWATEQINNANNNSNSASNNGTPTSTL